MLDGNFERKPRYERNIMIFDWLHTLDETATAAVEAATAEKETELPEK